MKNYSFFISLLMVMLLSVGNVWADADVTYDFTGSGWTVSNGTLSNGTVSFTGAGSANFKMSSGYFMFGKSGAYIDFPTYAKAVAKIVVTGRSGASASTGMNIYVGETAVSTATTGSTGTNTYEIAAASQAAGTTYTLKVTSNHNAQITKIEIYYKAETPAGTCATPTFSPAAGSYEGTQNVTISSTAGATIYYTTDGSTPTASSSVYSSPIAVSADMTIKAYAVKAEYDDSEVAEAAYTITEGPDVTLDFTTNNSWELPTTNTLDEKSYTSGDYTISIAGAGSGNGFKFSTNYLILGKSGAYIILPQFSSPVEKIVVVGNSAGSASGSVVFNIFDGNTPVSTAVTGCTTDKTFEIKDPAVNKQYTLRVTSKHNLQLKAIKFYFGEAPAVAKPTISGDENFVTSTTVKLACSTTGADVYYTTDGSDPKTSGTIGTSFSLTETATVRAIAKLGSDWSAEATQKTFTKVEALESLAALLGATTSTETAFNVVISNWVVTAVDGTRAWIADAANEKGILLYKSGHNFTVGNKLNGVVIGTKTKLYQGYPEMTTLVSTDVTVTTAEAITPRTTTIAALTSGHPNEQGTVVKLENLTYTASTTSFSDGENTLALNTQLYNPSMVDGAVYAIIGVVRYDNNNAISIMPRSADDIEQTGGGALPEVDGLAALKAEATGASYLVNLTNAIVTLVDGSNAFIEDATAGALIYFSGHGYAVGDKLNGQYEVTTATYQGKFEITAMEAQAGATKTADAEIPVTTMTIAQLSANFAANESKRIKIVGVNVTDAIANNDRNGQISDGANTFALYAGKNGVTAAENANIDIIGYPTFFNEAHQFNVWAQADITVNEKENPELAYSPATQAIEQGGAWSAPTLTNPHSVTIASYTSDNESVATVTDAGVIALAGGLGTAVITAHFNGDATYNAGNATYTITVNAADPRNNAVSPAEFTTTSGNLNPADITYESYKGGANTAPAIYNDGIRLYQAPSADKIGGYITLKAKKGCTIDQVKITTTNSYATTVAYSVDGNETLSGSESVAKSGSYTTGTGLNVSSVNIVNKGTGSSGRLEIASIKVWYTGNPLDVDHYFLGGTYETTFEQNGTFDYTGLEVYASYDAGETITEPVEGFTVDADLSTAGDKKAEVYLNEVKIAEYDITVTAGKENPALAYSPASATITAGDAWSAPTLSNTFHVSPITYSSDKESVATVDENGVITLAGGYGTAVITAHFHETAAYVESEATYTITVNKPAPTPTTTVYRKVTATKDITDGEYLIVYEGDAKHDAAVFDGSLDNVDQAMKVLAVEIENKEIAGNTDLDAATFTIDVTAGSLQSASGWYIGRTANSNGMDMSTTEAYVNTFAITGGAAVITGAGGCTLRYNYASDQLRFRYYKSGQQAIQLYKKESAEPVVPEQNYVEARTGLTVGKFYTICLPKNILGVRGATFWNLNNRDENGSMAYFVEAEAPFDAGKPYIFIATATTLEVAYGEENAGSPVANGALHGTFNLMTQNDFDAVSTANGNSRIYMLVNNQLRQVAGRTGNSLGANRAYVIYNELQACEPTPAPGRRVMAMPMNENVATGMDALGSDAQPSKIIVNGQLFIIRDGKAYDATGRQVSKF